jgi:flagellar protein FlaJ
VLFSAVSFAAALLATTSVALVLGTPVLLTVLFGFGASILSAVLVFGVLYGIPSMLATSRRRRMDLELPYVTTHLSILAAAGIPPARMFKLLEDSRTTPEVASEANEVVRDVEILGDDIITALEAERKRSPSSVFAEILEGLVATIRSGGNMKGYLQDATTTMMDLRRVAAKQLLEGLAAFADVYVTLLIVFPLLVIVMFSVMALIGGGLGGFSVTTMMSLVTYGIVPLSGGVVLVMLDSMLVED